MHTYKNTQNTLLEKENEEEKEKRAREGTNTYRMTSRHIRVATI